MAKQELKVAQDNADLQKQQANITEQQIAKANENDAITRANSFNDSLMSGLSLLRDAGSVEVRCAGVLMLEKCGKSNFVGSEEKEVVIESLNAFVRQRAALPIEMTKVSDWPNFFEWPKSEETEAQRRDIELAITSVASLLRTDEQKRGDKRNINLQELDLRGLRFENVDFSFLNFI